MTDRIIVRYTNSRSDGKTVTYATAGAAGIDLMASERCAVGYKPVLVSTGISVEIPAGYVGLVCSRSGLASKGISVLNAPGIIDSDYRGEIKVILFNHLWDPRLPESVSEYVVEPGDRVAQLLFMSVAHAALSLVGTLTPTARGSGGFGSTGT